MASFITSREWKRLMIPAVSIRPRGEPSRISWIRCSVSLPVRWSCQMLLTRLSGMMRRRRRAQKRSRTMAVATMEQAMIGSMTQPPASIVSNNWGYLG